MPCFCSGCFSRPPPLSLCFDLWVYPSELAWIWHMDLPLASLRCFAFMRSCSPFLVLACLWFWSPSTAAWCNDEAYIDCSIELACPGVYTWPHEFAHTQPIDTHTHTHTHTPYTHTQIYTDVCTSNGTRAHKHTHKCKYTHLFLNSEIVTELKESGTDPGPFLAWRHDLCIHTVLVYGHALKVKTTRKYWVEKILLNLCGLETSTAMYQEGI